LIFYKAFLNKNKEFDDFKVIPFEPTTLSWSGSATPIFQENLIWLVDFTSFPSSSLGMHNGC
jgi:hypothetical protein